MIDLRWNTKSKSRRTLPSSKQGAKRRAPPRERSFDQLLPALLSLLFMGVLGLFCRNKDVILF